MCRVGREISKTVSAIRSETALQQEKKEIEKERETLKGF
jgi:hypothetical protein